MWYIKNCYKVDNSKEQLTLSFLQNSRSDCCGFLYISMPKLKKNIRFVIGYLVCWNKLSKYNNRESTFRFRVVIFVSVRMYTDGRRKSYMLKSLKSEILHVIISTDFFSDGQWNIVFSKINQTTIASIPQHKGRWTTWHL